MSENHQHEVRDRLCDLVIGFAREHIDVIEPKIAAARAALRAAKDDPSACHSIAVWEQIDAALAALS